MHREAEPVPAPPERAELEQRLAASGLWHGDLCRVLRQAVLTPDEAAWVAEQLAATHRVTEDGLMVLVARCDDRALRERLTDRFMRRRMRRRGRPAPSTDPAVDLAMRRWLDDTRDDDPAACATHIWASCLIAREESVLLTAAGVTGSAIAELNWLAEVVAPMVRGDLASAAQLERTLDARRGLHEQLYAAVSQRRVDPIVARINDKRSLMASHRRAETLTFNPLRQTGLVAYRNVRERIGLGFHVEHITFFEPEVLDPRIIRIYPGRTNERHKHAHETVYCILEGEAEVQLDDARVAARAGDVVFIPRWAIHQATNVGEGELVILGVTDYGLTGRALMDHYLKHARMDRSTADLGRGSLETGTGVSWAVYGERTVRHLEHVLAGEVDVIRGFFDTLYTRHPELRLLDAGEPDARDTLYRTGLEAVVRKLNDASWFHQCLRAIGALYAEAGVTPQMYDWARAVALETLQAADPGAWRPAVEEAWCETFDAIVRVLTAGAEGIVDVPRAPDLDAL